MYTMDINAAEKTFFIKISGFFKMDEAVQYMADFKKNLAKIPNVKDYHLVIDAKEQKTVAQDVQVVMAEAISLYVSTPFKSHHTVMFDSAISKNQIMRAGNTAFANTFKFHDTVDEALRSCKGTAGNLR